MSETAWTMVEVEGHWPQVEHLHEQELWQATCPCGFSAPPRENVHVAGEDRAEHENAVGIRIEVYRDTGEPVE